MLIYKKRSRNTPHTPTKTMKTYVIDLAGENTPTTPTHTISPQVVGHRYFFYRPLLQPPFQKCSKSYSPPFTAPPKKLPPRDTNLQRILMTLNYLAANLKLEFQKTSNKSTYADLSQLDVLHKNIKNTKIHNLQPSFHEIRIS